MKMRFRKIMAAILSTAMVAAAIPASGILNVQAKSPQEHIDLSRQVAGEGMCTAIGTGRKSCHVWACND